MRGLEEPAHASRGLFLINTLLLYPSLSPYSQTERQKLVRFTLFYSTLLTFTDGQNYRQRNKYTRLAWAGGTCPRFAWAEGTFFPVVLLCQFLVVAEIVLGDTYLSYQLCRCVFFVSAAGNSFWLHRSVFWLWREIVLGVTSLPTIPVVPLCQFFCCGGK